MVIDAGNKWIIRTCGTQRGVACVLRWHVLIWHSEITLIACIFSSGISKQYAMFPVPYIGVMRYRELYGTMNNNTTHTPGAGCGESGYVCTQCLDGCKKLDTLCGSCNSPSRAPM